MLQRRVFATVLAVTPIADYSGKRIVFAYGVDLRRADFHLCLRYARPLAGFCKLLLSATVHSRVFDLSLIRVYARV